MKIAYAGDREISVKILEHLLENSVKPLALLIPDKSKQSHSEELKKFLFIS